MFKIYTPLSSLAQNCLVATNLLILGFWLPTFFSQLPAHALELSSRRSFFEKSPRLIRAATSFRGPAALANYSFTIELPEDAGAPMSAVTIVQQPNVEQILLYPNRSRVFREESSNSERSIPAQIIDISSETPEVKVVFEQPIQPGTTVTVSLRARNPLYGGIYQFGVTAFPVSENNDGLYLGSGRLQFSQPGGGIN
ncbi:DUF2808 domain-containing protein [Pleurocapsales cyanobacterium LEGE 06147]|nr:DUF2808 domain-containing protein [Pleurocapsales cyanobacterium LEGE 06147]